MNDDLLPISRISQYAYCPRRFWYMYVQGEMLENAHVVRGILNHKHAHTPGYETTEENVVVHRQVYVYSHTLGVTGICDLVEEAPDGTLTPIEYKQGRKGRWMNDQSQLCAQALCLEEMSGRPVTEGFIFYFGSRRRVPVAFDESLRATTRRLIQEMRHALAEGEIPPHTPHRQRCRGCSLAPICLPEETEQLLQEGAHPA
jgi:CRISPR-associated exonuclease Cas4